MAFILLHPDPLPRARPGAGRGTGLIRPAAG